MSSLTMKHLPYMLTVLLRTYTTMVVLMIIVYLSIKNYESKKIEKLNFAKYMTYISIALNMSFIIFISVVAAEPRMSASFFLLFNVLLPALYVLKKKEIVFTQVISVIVFLVLGQFFRQESFVADLYLALSSLAIGLPFNFMIFNVKMSDKSSKMNYLEEANIDELSGLPNRRALNKSLEKIYSKDDYECALVAMIDLDDFKQINDTKGHLEGDSIIKELGVIFKKFSKENQLTISRIGGDEFVLIGLNIQRPQVNKILNDFLNTLNEQSSRPLGVSVGAFYTCHPNKYKSEDAVLIADEALYDVKKTKKGNIKVVIDEE